MDKNALARGEQVAKRGIINLLFLGLLKLFAGVLTGLTILIADAVNSFADILGIFASYIGLRLSRKGADKNFEYGYHKVETFAAFLISLGIMYMGYEVLLQSVDILFRSHKVQLQPFAITTTVIAMFFSARLYKKFKKAAEETNSLSLMANARDKKIDIFSGVAILATVIASYKNIPYIEGITSSIISILILKEGIMSAKESLFFLLDYWDDPILLHKIKKALRKEPMVSKVRKIRLRRAGAFIFGEAYIDINPYIELTDVREELIILKGKIQELNSYIKDFSVFTNIPKIDNEVIAIPIKRPKDLQSPVAFNLKDTKAYIFIKIKDNSIKSHKIIKISDKDKKPVELADFLAKNKANIVIENQLSSLVYYNLRRVHNILIYPNFPDIKTVEKTIKLLLIDT